MYCSDTHSVSSTKKFVNSDYNDQHRIFHAGSSGTRRYNVTTKTSCLSGKKILKAYIFSLIKDVLLSKSDNTGQSFWERHKEISLTDAIGQIKP